MASLHLVDLILTMLARDALPQQLHHLLQAHKLAAAAAVACLLQSTLLKALGGLVPVASGQLITDTPSGFVFQNPDHQVVMPTVAADVAFGLGRCAALPHTYPLIRLLA